MKTFIKIISTIIALTLLLSAFSFSAFADAPTHLHFSLDDVNVGDEVTVSVSINQKVSMDAVSFTLEFNEEIFNYTGGPGTLDPENPGTIIFTDTPNSRYVYYSFKFIANTEGSAGFYVKNCKYAANSTETNFTGASAPMKIKDAGASSDAKLSELKISGYTLNPEFSSSKTSYTLKVPNDVKKLDITTTTNDKDAKVLSIDGNKDFKVGENTVTITVEAKNGTKKKYTIKVTRAKEDDKDISDNENNAATLETMLGDKKFILATKIPKDILFKGFSIEETSVNGVDIETAVDKEENFRLFYLMPADAETLEPYLYNEDLDQFEKLKYINFNNRCYILNDLPDDLKIPESMFATTINLGGNTVSCLSHSDQNLADFHYVYCFTNGNYEFYRYDSNEDTLQRYPDLEYTIIKSTAKSEGFLQRFSSLSTNGKIIFIGVIVLFLGLLLLIILMIIHFIKKTRIPEDDIILSDADIGFEEIEIKKDNAHKE